MYMSYLRLIHDTRKQNTIQPRRIAAIRVTSTSQVRHIHDPVSSIDRDRNYNICITMAVLFPTVWYHFESLWY